MIICKCDRCGKEETINTVYPYLFGDEGHKPKFFITKNEGANVKMIHLCPDCEKAFEEFLKPKYKVNWGDDIFGFGCRCDSEDIPNDFKVGDKVKIKPENYNPDCECMKGFKDTIFSVTGILPTMFPGKWMLFGQYIDDKGNKRTTSFRLSDMEKVEETK